MNTQWYNAGMKPTYVPPLTEQQLAELDDLYRKTKVPRLRTRAQMILLSAENRLKIPEIAEIVRESDATVLRWLKRYMAEGVNGLEGAPRPGRERTVTDAYREKLVEAVRRRPRSLDLPFSMWTLPGRPKKHYGLGAVNYHTGETVVIIRRRKRRKEVADLLQLLVDKHRTGTIYVAGGQCQHPRGR